MGMHSTGCPFFLPFNRGPLAPLRKLLLSKNRCQGDEKGLLNLKAIRDALALARKIICINRQNSNNEYTVTKSPNKIKAGDIVYVKDILHHLRLKVRIWICIIKFHDPTQCFTEEHSKWQIQIC